MTVRCIVRVTNINVKASVIKGFTLKEERGYVITTYNFPLEYNYSVYWSMCVYFNALFQKGCMYLIMREFKCCFNLYVNKIYQNKFIKPYLKLHIVL